MALLVICLQAAEDLKHRGSQRTVHAKQQHARSEQPAALAGEESPEPARPYASKTLLSMPAQGTAATSSPQGDTT